MKTQTNGTETKGKLLYLSVENILPHPDNPRKDLGDLSELAASIKENGVLQNLTVVRSGHPKQDVYTCIIGHRRLAAAKIAGLSTVPCVITEMSEVDQVKTMLMENMQRSDLTITEQADGFQMMLDLGADVDEIAVQSGFSKTTIHHRLQLRELDRQTLEHRITFGATLMDLIKLEQIEDQKTRNKVLEFAGTMSFNYEMRRALDEQAARKNKPKWIALMETFAKKLSKEETKAKEWRPHGYFSYSSEPEKFSAPEDAGTVTYGFYADASTIALLKYFEHSSEREEEDTEKAALKAHIQQTEETLKDISKRAFSLRLDFIRNHRIRQKDVPHITRYLLSLLIDREIRIGFTVPNDDTVNALFEISADLEWGEKKKLRDSAFPPLLNKDPDKALLFMAYAAAGDSPYCKYYTQTWNRNFPYFQQNKLLDALYDFLELLGYPISDEEALLMSGEHPAFQPGKEEAENMNNEADESDDEEDDEEDDANVDPDAEDEDDGE